MGQGEAVVAQVGALVAQGVALVTQGVALEAQVGALDAQVEALVAQGEVGKELGSNNCITLLGIAEGSSQENRVFLKLISA